MGHPNDTSGGVRYRTSLLFNSKTFSDIEFSVRDADVEEYKVFYAHKLILSMAGERFARLFYEKPAAQKSIKILDSSPHIFEMMLQYVYCDIINISNLEEAMDLVKLAKKFCVYDLTEKCDAYISQFQVTIDTVFAKYESAMSYQHHQILPICRRFVCQNTKDVFESPKFCNASLAVVQDILKLDNLSVPNEIEVIDAAMWWGKAECKRTDRPPAALPLRAATYVLFKHLRFSCLNVNDFLTFVEKNDILTNIECTKVTAKILDKDNTSLTLPEGFSSICTPRRGFITSDSQSMASSRPLETNHSVSRSSYSPPLVHKSEANIQASNFRQTYPKTNTNIPPVQVSNSQNTNGQPLYQFVPPKKNAPVLKVIPQTKTIRAYEFSLHEMQKEMSSAFSNDVKCNATISMLRGNIVIHGIELRVEDSKKTSTKDLIEVHLCLSNKLAHKSNSHAVQLQNNTLELSLNESYKVSPDNPLDIEVTIEDLKLGRCSVCRLEESTVELNCGLGITAKISVNSNQSNGTDSFFFLISKIIYSIP